MNHIHLWTLALLAAGVITHSSVYNATRDRYSLETPCWMSEPDMVCHEISETIYQAGGFNS